MQSPVCECSRILHYRVREAGFQDLGCGIPVVRTPGRRAGFYARGLQPVSDETYTYDVDPATVSENRKHPPEIVPPPDRIRSYPVQGRYTLPLCLSFGLELSNLFQTMQVSPHRW